MQLQAAQAASRVQNWGGKGATDDLFSISSSFLFPRVFATPQLVVGDLVRELLSSVSS
jgi:hypothetical protein